MVINNHGKSYQCLATPVIQVIGSRQRKPSKKESSFQKMCASPWYYIQNQVIAENLSFSLFPSQDIQRATIPGGTMKTSVL
jgi:hypothetical protein